MDYNLINTELSQLLRETYRKTDALLAPISDKYGFNIMKVKNLFELGKNDDLTIGDIGVLVGMAGGNISNLCKALEKEGYVSRKRSEKDERIVTVRLTEKGKKIIENIVDEISEKYKKQIKLTNEEYNSIIKSLNLLNEKLNVELM